MTVGESSGLLFVWPRPKLRYSDRNLLIYLAVFSIVSSLM